MSTSNIQPRLDTMLEGFHQQIIRIEQLERRIEERTARARRRIANLLDLVPSHRRSHLRLFVTHSYQAPDISPDPSKLMPSHWTLQVEGKLLVSHLDHAHAELFDKKKNYNPSSEDLERYRMEKEEEAVKPVNFTHLFDQLSVQFQTVYAPKVNPMAKKTPVKKSSRRLSASKTKSPQPEESETKLFKTSETTEMQWKKSLTDDAHAFQIQYTAPPPPAHSMQLHSVVATLKLYPTTAGREPVFRVSPHLEEALFNGPEFEAIGKGKKRKAEDIGAAEIPPSQNEIDIPQGLTMAEITNTFVVYITDKNLCDENDRSTIHCDVTLQGLLGEETFQFSQLETLLLARGLLRKITEEPVKLTYIMTENTATLPPDATGNEENTPSLMQLDMDITVPSLFPYRARELMRRVKRREVEYTSARTRAKYLLLSRRGKDEEDIKQKIDRAVNCREFGEDNVEIHLTIAEAAAPNTEVRVMSQLDAKISYLLARLEERQKVAKNAWDTVESYRSLAQDNKDVGH